MSKRLVTKKVFIDTSIFENSNFFYGSHLDALFNYSNRELIEVYLTTITKNEILNRLKVNLSKAVTNYNKVFNAVKRDANNKILKTLDIFKNLHEFDNILFEKAVSELVFKLDTNLRYGKIKMIDIDYAQNKQVFDQYFSEKPPFSGLKKFEFPDAFVINAIENFCIKNKTRMYVLSKDDDFSRYHSYRLIHRNNISSLLEQIAFNFDHQGRIPKILGNIEKHLLSIYELINRELVPQIEFKTDKEDYCMPTFDDLKIIDYKIIALFSDRALIEFTVKLLFHTTLVPSEKLVSQLHTEDHIRPAREVLDFGLKIFIEVEFKNLTRFKFNWVKTQAPFAFYY